MSYGWENIHEYIGKDILVQCHTPYTNYETIITDITILKANENGKYVKIRDKLIERWVQYDGNDLIGNDANDYYHFKEVLK